MELNGTQILDKYSLESPTKCYKLRILGIFYVLLFLASTVFNSLLFYVFIKNKNLRTAFNLFIIALIILNLIGTFTELPFVVSDYLK